jgi:pimeloyl-ACP methyl ester carboxylesterase
MAYRRSSSTESGSGYGVRFSAEMFTRGCHWIPRIPLGCPLLLPVGTVNCVQTLKAFFHSGSFVARLESTEGCRAVGYEGCGHWVMWEKAERLNEDMRRFLSE